MTNTNRLWKVLAALMVVSFSILLYFGHEIYISAPPIPAAVKTTSGETLFTREQYDMGRQVWQSVGGHEMGSIWGHGSYVAPDWSADWLHREATGLLDLWATRDTGKAFADLDSMQQASLRARLETAIRTNTTPLHGHTALFGVYGMLGIGLMLFCLRGLSRTAYWDEKLLAKSFWAMNIGLALMALLSLLPMGLLQVQAAVSHGFWYARSADFLQQPLMQTIVWLRMPGDVIFAAGALMLALFVFRLFVGKAKEGAVAPVNAEHSVGLGG